jgi:hypothetical protein
MVVSSLADKSWTWVKVGGSDKHTSLVLITTVKSFILSSNGEKLSVQLVACQKRSARARQRIIFRALPSSGSVDACLERVQQARA